jgi:two-component system sensor histidine kinase CpxA
METERTPLVTTPLRAIVEKVVATEASDTNVEINIPPDMQVKAKPAMLERALANLVRNSRRYAATGTGTGAGLSTRTGASADTGLITRTGTAAGTGLGTEPIELVAQREGAEVKLSVRDRGPGVPDAALARLGEPFFRPQLARDRASGGFGLGLAIVQRCVAACNGEVQFRNRSGGGFEAEITLTGA